MGTSGSGRRAMRTGKATRDTMPMASAIQATGSFHSPCWPRMRPNERPPTASTATSDPSQSKRPDPSSSRDSATWRWVAHSATARTGTFTRKATRQPMVSTRVPPTMGPSTVSAEVAAAQIPKARPRWSPGNAWVMIDSAPGTRNAPEAPCSSRKTTSHSRVGARPHSAEVTAKLARPMA